MLCFMGATAAHAEPIPEYVLDHDYVTCMGGENPAKDPQRANYCACVRDSMRSWSLETYGAVAEAQSKAQNAQQVPSQIATLAKFCMQKIGK
jgi:hypothetical protein